jgi:hypothetical protein
LDLLTEHGFASMSQALATLLAEAMRVKRAEASQNPRSVWSGGDR